MGIFHPKDKYTTPQVNQKLNTGDPINNGLVGYWPLNEGVGTTLKDVTINARNLTTSGSPKKQPSVGKFNSALRFDSAASQFANYNDTGDAFSFPNTTFSVSFWMRSKTTNANNLIITKHIAGTNSGWYFNLISATSMQLALRGATALTTLDAAVPSGSFADGRWHHVVGVFTTNTTNDAVQNLKIYLDGDSVSGTVFHGGGAYVSPGSTINLAFASRQGASPLYYDGDLALVRIYNRGINLQGHSEIKRLYNEPYAGVEKHAGIQALTLAGIDTVTSGTLSTSVFDGKIIIKSSGTNLLDGKVQIKDVITSLLDGKVAIGSVQQDLLDGKLTIKDVAVSFLDGKVMVKDIATSLLDGQIVITQGGVGSDLLDGKIQIKDALTALVDGKVIVKSVATDLLDGKLSIGTMATNLLDGKLQIKDIATALLDGKIQVKSATVDLVDGKIIIADGVTSFSSNNQLLIDSVGGKVLQLGNTRINTWNTAGRPASPKTGTIGFNTQTVALDIYDGAAWKSVVLS